MENIKSFLGFTDNIKEPQKTRIEKQLDKLYRYNENIYNAKTYLLIHLLEGRKPKIKQDVVTINRRTGEYNKPKTIYKLKKENEDFFYEINKTEYNFCVYCLENGFTDENAVNLYIIYENARIEDKKRKEEERIRLQKEKKQQEQEEREFIKNMMLKEVETLPVAEKELMNNIFLHINGLGATQYSYTLIAYIHNFDNPICKEEIINRLKYNDNKASIKTFECITGLKLPKSMGKRISYLESVTSADFKGITEFKPRKKKEERESHKEEFYILIAGDNSQWSKVFAEPITKYGIDMFIFCNKEHWNLSLAESGLMVTSGKTKTECMKNLKNCIDRNGKDSFVKLVKERTEMINNKIGINPRYSTI